MNDRRKTTSFILYDLLCRDDSHGGGEEWGNSVFDANFTALEKKTSCAIFWISK